MFLSSAAILLISVRRVVPALLCVENLDAGNFVQIEERLRFSDDGEPGGTAGRPILSAITSSGLDHVMVVVTRWAPLLFYHLRGNLMNEYTKEIMQHEEVDLKCL